MNKQFLIENKYFSICLMIITGILALFFWEGKQGFSISDEGFLWYGVQRVLAGEVPVRDFNAYDIGRYYWAAAFMKLAGDNGVVTLRISAMLFQAIALCIGLSILVRISTKQNCIYWLLAVISLLVWMVHRHRLFDMSLPIILIGSLSLLVEKPSTRRYFWTGLIVGLVAVFGQNHGLYGALGSISIMLYLIIKRENAPNLITAFASWSSGVVVGYLPVLIFLVFVPGFAFAFWEGIRILLFEIKATNIPLPVPWPWLVPFGQLSAMNMLYQVTQGAFFVFIVVFGILGIVYVLRQRLQNNSVSPILVASVFLSFPYAHYTFSRADLTHLAFGITPFLMGIFALLTNQPTKIKWPFAVLLCSMSLFLMLPIHPGWECHSNKKCVNIKVGEENLRIPVKTALILKELHQLTEQYVPSNRTFIAVPFCPGAYTVLRRKSPMWDIYPIFPSSAASQQAEIERIKAANPSLVIIDNSPLDGREDLCFRNTHPIIYQYIQDNFERQNDFTQNPAIYKSKQTGSH